MDRTNRSASNFDLNTPGGRYAASQALGTDEYNRAMREHIAKSCVETVNGYGIRPVQTRFGLLFQVGTTQAFDRIEKAREHAMSRAAGGVK